MSMENTFLNNEFREKAKALVSRMTIEEAASQLRYDSPAIERLGIPAYNWWNEGLHGLARAGTATVFPQAIALAAMFDEKMLKEIADTVATEARAKYNESTRLEDRDLYKGITMWSPNINIFRDSRWGRGQETYGEDPFLTSKLGAAFIEGLQGDGRYMKVAACAKHYAVHSGPEASRHEFDAQVTEKDLEETYLPAFKTAVTEAGVAGVMGAYNRVNGEPACAHSDLVEKRLREQWGFEGYFVSDFLALMDFHEGHKVTKDAVETAAMALKASCDVNAGIVYQQVMKAYEKGMITEEDIRKAAVNAYTVRTALGMFSDDCEYDSLGLDDIDTDESAELSYRSSINSVVMLKNDGILPLDKNSVKKIGIIGPTATSLEVLNGNYNGTSSRYVHYLDGIRAAVNKDTKVYYSEGAHLFENKVQNLALDDDRLSEAEMVARNSDVVILCVGLDATIEGEQGDTGNAFAAGDKVSLFLPDSQRRLIERVVNTGAKIIMVCNTGSAIDLSYENENVNAILECWYSGQVGGKALADIIFGEAVPSGKLPVTFYKNGTEPDINDYSMKGRTYRYLSVEPVYPFGYGLSYNKYSYEDMSVTSSGDNYVCHVTVQNNGSYAGDEIVEVYISNDPQEKLSNGKNDSIENLSSSLDPDNQPKYSLCGFGRVSLGAGESKTVDITLGKTAFDTVLEDGRRVKLAGVYKIYVGGQQPDKKSEALTGQVCLETVVNIER